MRTMVTGITCIYKAPPDNPLTQAPVQGKLPDVVVRNA